MGVIPEQQQARHEAAGTTPMVSLTSGFTDAKKAWRSHRKLPPSASKLSGIMVEGMEGVRATKPGCDPPLVQMALNSGSPETRRRMPPIFVFCFMSLD
jgi:hypothetical protein